MSDAEVASRRQFILAAAAAVVSVSAVNISGAVTASDLLQRVLRALGYDDASAATTAAIDARLARILRTKTLSAPTGDLKQRIRDNIAADYRAGALRVVDGWWLSETEADCLELIAGLS